ncbi:MAG: LysE family transporter [Actinobacteria bacterium]|nr:LysE family transporter [Actinomycetota bacterium]
MDLAGAAAAFGVGVALGVIPGPVQILIVSESARAGIRGGLRVLAGANGTFAVFLVALAAGLSALDPSEAFLRVVKVAGGGFLVFLGVDAFRSARLAVEERAAPGSRRHPTARGVLAVVLNPGLYIFLATTASAVLADAASRDGRAGAFLVAGAMLVGVSSIDAAMMLLGTGGRRALGERFVRGLGVVLSLALVALGVLYVVQGVVP